MGEFEAHVRCVFPWLLVTDFEFVFVFLFYVCTGLLVGGAQCKPNSQ